jgi:hypothetical protein
MSKLDLKKEFRECYTAPADRFQIVCVPRMQFLMVDGCGDPNKAPRFEQCVQSLYSVAYCVKLALRKAGGHEDYVVGPLEGLWWTDDPVAFTLDKRDTWKWTLMLAQPQFITETMVWQAVADASAGDDAPLSAAVRLESLEEGLCCQILHVGPNEDEAATIARMHAFIHAKGHHLRGRHHEIYMNDPRRNAPQKRRTILRQAIM